MVDVNKLKGKIVEKGYNISTVAEKIGVNKASFYRKLNANGESFTVGEANKIVSLLKISNDEATAIFFAHPVA